MQPEFIEPINRSAVPFFEPLSGFEWIEDFLKVEQAETELKELSRKKGELHKTIPTRENYKKRRLKNLDDYLEDQAKLLAAHLMRNANSGNPLKRLAYGQERLSIRCNAELLEKAIDLMPDDFFSSMTDAAITKELKSIEKAQADLKDKIIAHSPESYFLFDGGRIRCDSRKEFVSFWRSAQNRVKATCDPQGYALHLAPESVQQAYERLNVRDWVFENSIYLPCPELRPIDKTKMNLE